MIAVMVKKASVWLTFVLAAIALSFSLRSRPNSGEIKLILVIAVDQMRFDYLDRFAEVYVGGFKTLRARGAIFNNALYRHANSETGPGHSVILTGRHASHSGIVANSWYDSYLKKRVNVVEDPVHTALGSEGRGASPANLIGFTVGDVLKKKNPDTKVIGVSLKDRSAVLMGGKRADAAYWYDPSNGNFVSSTYYMNQLPGWLQKWNARKIPDSMQGKKWERLNPDTSLYDRLAGPDAIEGEWDRKDIVFPHLVRGKPADKDYYEDLRRFPDADAWTLEIALEAMKNHDLGTDQTVDILAVGFSASDIIGHTYGPDSHEILDLYMRLDLMLQKLFEVVDERTGLDHTIVVLTSDHGVMPLVENMKKRGMDTKRVDPSILDQKVADALAAQYPGKKDLIAATDHPHFYLNDQAIERAGLNKLDVEATIVKVMKESGLFVAVYTQSDFAANQHSDDPFFRLCKNSFFAPRSPDVIGVPKAYLYMDNYPGGTGHGTVHPYDRHVPVVFFGAGFRPGRYSEEAGPEDIAPTLAAVLGIEFPKEDDSRILSEMMPKD